MPKSSGTELIPPPPSSGFTPPGTNRPATADVMFNQANLPYDHALSYSEVEVMLTNGGVYLWNHGTWYPANAVLFVVFKEDQ